jgi:outer membrane putative beta-barrel porin/alpha-amylase
MRRLSFVTFVLLALALEPRATEACSMCRCGDPTFSLVDSQLFVPKLWHFGLDTGRYAKDQVAEADALTREKEEEDRVTLSVSRTLGRRLTLVGQLPFTHRTITTPSEQGSLSGISDPALLAHYLLYSPGAGSWISLGVGLRPGWGQNDRQRGGERAEEHLQPATGAAGVEPGISFSRFVGGDGSVFGSAGGRFNGRNDAGYHYGNAVLANLGYEKKLSQRFNGILELNFRRAAKDEPVRGLLDENTGGSVLYVSPRVLVKLDRAVFLRLGVQVPVAKSLYGDQDEKVNFLTGLTVRF